MAILGGGVWVPRLCALLAERWSAPEVSLRLMARRLDRLEAVASRAAADIAGRPGWRVTATTERGAALEGADFVVLMVRVGGYAARTHDESFPRAFGCAGDEGLGPGGLANAWRTVPWMTELATEVRARAPNAVALDLMAPLGITTRVLLDAGVRAVGLCELPLVTLRALAGRGATARYGGLNHLGWFWDVAGRPGAHPLKYLSRVFGDGAPPPGRAGALDALSDRLVAAYAQGDGAPVVEAEVVRPTPWFDDALVPALVALAGHDPWYGYANVANDGLLPELPADHVVEVAARFDEGGVRPVRPGALPPEVVPFLTAAARADTLALEAARTRDPALLAEAMAALPLPLDVEQVRGLTQQAIVEVGS